MATSLVLPCYNPSGGWEQHILSGYSSFCRLAGEPVELVIVLDGVSKNVDNENLSFLQSNIPLIKIISYPDNKGKGYALRQGVKEATGDLVIYTDVDFPYTLESMYVVYKGLKNDDYDVGVGVKNAEYYRHVPLLRRAISRFLRLLIRVFLSMPVTDTQCGLKGFRKDVAPLFQQTTINRYLFDLEFIRNCFKGKKYRVQAIPVALNENVHFRKMDYRILLPEMLNFVKLLFK